VEVLRPRNPEIPQGDPIMVEKALEVLVNSKRPVIFVGEEVQALGGTDKIINLAERLGAAVVTGDGAKGAFPENHPLSLGQALGKRIWGENPVQDWIGTCDAALILGSTLYYRSTVGVGLNLPDTVIHVLLDGEAIGKNYNTAVPIAANSEAVVSQLLEGIGNRDVDKGNSYRKEIAQLKEQTYKVLQDTWGNELRTFEAIRSVLPEDTIFALDATVPASRAARCLEMNTPHSFIGPHGWMGIGFGFPAALGAKVGQPSKPVVCVTGDGGFQYNAQELGTAVQYGISPVVLIFNDNAWGVLKGYQSGKFGANRMMATDLVNPDFLKLFDSYGISGTRVNTVSELTRALEVSVNDDHINLIEVMMPNGLGGFV
jgi:acetolactate synthase-1/2/3 large subunit